jgi:outer membrane protein OmpA-like peptidoglycan-associated protein
MCSLIIALFLIAPAFASEAEDSGSFQVQEPKGSWQQPGEIQVPTGPWQEPGEIRVPKGIQALHTTKEQCEERLSVVADALFDFDSANLRNDAEETLVAAGPEIAKLGNTPSAIEGHTGAIGSDAYNITLSEARARAVRDWLAVHGYVPPETPIKGFGEMKPIAPNATADGKEDPIGRQKNCRVEIVFARC